MFYEIKNIMTTVHANPEQNRKGKYIIDKLIIGLGWWCSIS